MPSYKLYYFDIKALAEPIRFIFAHAGVEYVDERLTEDAWKQLKPNTPFGQVPVLEVDGKMFNQSNAICRYLAKEFNLYSENNLEALEIDATVDNINDFRMKVTSPHYEQNAEAKAQKLVAAKEAIPFFIERFDAQVKKNGGFFVGGKLSYADLIFVALLDMLNFRAGHDILEKAENLKALREKVLALPGIKSWVEKRPKSDI